MSITPDELDGMKNLLAGFRNLSKREANRLMEEFDAHRSEIARLRETVNIAATERFTLNTRIDDLTKQREALDRDNARLRERVEAAEKEKSDLTVAFDAVKFSAETHRESLRKVEADRDALRARCGRVVEAINDYLDSDGSRQVFDAIKLSAARQRLFSALSSALAAATGAKMDSEQLAHELAEAFIRWPLPESVCSDLCATKQGPGRIGTNLLSYVEARQMMREVVLPKITAASALAAAGGGGTAQGQGEAG